MDEQAHEGEYHRYQNFSLVLVRAAAIWSSALIMVAMAIAVVLGPNSDGAVVTIIWTAFGVVAVLLLWLGFRVTASGIFSGPDGVAVRRVLLRRVWLPWSDITGFELIRAGRLDNGFTRQSVAIAILRTDGNQRLYCLGASFTRRQPAADQMITALGNDRAEAIRSEAIRSSAELRARSNLLALGHS
ncbi:MAG: PH domain-containing protein [Actinobacteria bacterium]|nr:PH domain-containing protein [Actinomycetota bacterium]